MINKESVLAAFPLASSLAEKGTVIGARENTQLSRLVQVTNDEFLKAESYYTPDGDLEIKSYALNLESVTNGTLDAPSTHDMELDQKVEQIARAVLRHISFARNVVKPVVIDFREKLEIRLKAASMASPADDFNIKSVQLPELFQDEVFKSQVLKFDSRPLRPDSFINFSSKTVDEINALMLTGDKDQDEAIVSWQTRLGPDDVLKVWHSFFCTDVLQGVTDGSTFALDRLEVLPTFFKADIFLAIYLLASKLFDQTEEAEGKAASLAAYQNLVAQLRDYAGATLSFLVKDSERMTDLEFLVAWIDRDKKEIQVLKPIYDQWLENGGKPEVLLGLLVSNKELRSVLQINANAVELEQIWNSHCAYYNNIRQNKMFVSTKEAILSTYFELLNDASEEELAARKYLADYETRATKKVNELVESFVTSDLENLNEVSLRVIGSARFYYCEAECILRDIEEAARVNPKIDIREAAYLAAMNYVVDFVSDQLVKVPG